MQIDTLVHALPHGIDLHCRVAGEPGRPLLLFLHGFPEGAFVWDPLLAHFSDAAQGGWRCVAPFLRGYAPSSAPPDVSAYRAKALVQDIAALIAHEAGAQGSAAAVVAHDWGGALAWNLAALQPELLQRLMILNAPHPGAFLRELQGNPAQQEASRYMHFLCRPDAEALLAADGFRRLEGFFARPGGDLPDWYTPALRQRYHELWSAGLTGPCNYYRASPLRPPREGEAPVQLPPELLKVSVPTLVLWGLEDPALLPTLLDGLDAWVPRLRVQPLPGASHWIVHEQEHRVMLALTGLLADDHQV